MYDYFCIDRRQNERRTALVRGYRYIVMVCVVCRAQKYILKSFPYVDLQTSILISFYTYIQTTTIAFDYLRSCPATHSIHYSVMYAVPTYLLYTTRTSLSVTCPRYPIPAITRGEPTPAHHHRRRHRAQSKHRPPSQARSRSRNLRDFTRGRGRAGWVGNGEVCRARRLNAIAPVRIVSYRGVVWI